MTPITLCLTSHYWPLRYYILVFVGTLGEMEEDPVDEEDDATDVAALGATQPPPFMMMDVTVRIRFLRWGEDDQRPNKNMLNDEVSCDMNGRALETSSVAALIIPIWRNTPMTASKKSELGHSGTNLLSKSPVDKKVETRSAILPTHAPVKTLMDPPRTGLGEKFIRFQGKQGPYNCQACPFMSGGKKNQTSLSQTSVCYRFFVLTFSDV